MAGLTWKQREEGEKVISPLPHSAVCVISQRWRCLIGRRVHVSLRALKH